MAQVLERAWEVVNDQKANVVQYTVGQVGVPQAPLQWILG